MKVCVLGSNGFIGQNLLKGHDDWIGISRSQLNLLNQCEVDLFFETENYFDVIIHCAAVLNKIPDVLYKNILMFENVARNIQKIGKLIYFSSGAAKLGNPPNDPYGLSKWIIDKRISSMGPNVFSLCIWGCYGPGELPRRFSAICKNEGHITIKQDMYFDFIDVEDVKKSVEKYCNKGGQKFDNLVYFDKKLKLSEWAIRFGATFTILEEGLGKPYICS